MTDQERQSLGSFAYGMTDASAAAAPAFAEAYERMVRVTDTNGFLTPKTRDLIGLAVNASPTHLNRDATLAHVESAISNGASEQEILEVLQLASCLGVHTIVHGVPRLVTAAPEMVGDELTPRQQQIKDRWFDQRGYWPESFDGLLARDPEYFDACSDFQNAPFGGAIDPKLRELIFVAIDSSTTHMYANVERHIQLALEYGATPDEVLATLELTTLIGVQSYTLGYEALEEVRARAAAQVTSRTPA